MNNRKESKGNMEDAVIFEPGTFVFQHYKPWSDTLDYGFILSSCSPFEYFVLFPLEFNTLTFTVSRVASMSLSCAPYNLKHSLEELLDLVDKAKKHNSNTWLDNFEYLVFLKNLKQQVKRTI